MPALKLSEDAIKILVEYHWQGNIRQLRNIAEQMSVLEKDRILSLKKLEIIFLIVGVNFQQL